MAALPIELPGDLAARLARAVDGEGKIARALDTLGPVAGRDVVLLGSPTGSEEAASGPVEGGLAALGARLMPVTTASQLRFDLPDGSADAVVSLWSRFRGVDEAEVAEADRVLRPGGRLLVVHDYGRDDVSRLRGDLPEYGQWSRRNGPFLRGGFRIRVVHCFWTFESVPAAVSFLSEAFGPAGSTLAEALTRPRLTYKVAVYHRSRGGDPASGPAQAGPATI